MINGKDNIIIHEEPEYLIVLYLTKKGDVYEVYNGPGRLAWESASKKDNHNYHHMRVNKLLELNDLVSKEDRIEQIKPIEKMKKEYKNKKIRKDR